MFESRSTYRSGFFIDSAADATSPDELRNLFFASDKPRLQPQLLLENKFCVPIASQVITLYVCNR